MLTQRYRKLWQKPKATLGALWKQRLIEWRKEPATVRLEHPTRLDRARSLGYKAKQGIFVVRERVPRGGHTRKVHGKKSRRMGKRLVLQKNYQRIAEERANTAYPNCEVINSYWVGKDGRHYWFEVIMADRMHPQVHADTTLSWVKTTKGRVYRGITSAGRKTRGLRWKGKGSEHARRSK